MGKHPGKVCPERYWALKKTDRVLGEKAVDSTAFFVSHKKPFLKPFVNIDEKEKSGNTRRRDAMFRKSRMGGARNFIIAKLMDKTPGVDLHRHYRLLLKKSLIVSLLSVILLFLFFPKLRMIKQEVPVTPRVDVVVNIEDIPITRQGRSVPPPPEPAVPIPTEEESVPEDVTIESTELDFDYAPPSLPGGMATGGLSITPRPINSSFPKYPDEIKKKGIEGTIQLDLRIDKHGNVVDVRVVRNTSSSKQLAKYAMEAAYDLKFTPAKIDSKAVSIWVSWTYKFELLK